MGKKKSAKRELIEDFVNDLTSTIQGDKNGDYGEMHFSSESFGGYDLDTTIDGMKSLLPKLKKMRKLEPERAAAKKIWQESAKYILENIEFSLVLEEPGKPMIRLWLEASGTYYDMPLDIYWDDGDNKEEIIAWIADYIRRDGRNQGVEEPKMEEVK
jgi:hypothetical protein